MSTQAPPVLGQEVTWAGNITQNTWVGPRSARNLEVSLGYAEGRLSPGWAVLVLKEKLAPLDFEFDGITLRSGGREGLPAASWEAEALRPRVHAGVLRERGVRGYRLLQRWTLATIAETGQQRLVKVVPVTPHTLAVPPDQQYPMGGGGLQWKLKRPCRFLVAMTVDAGQIAAIPGFTAYIGEGGNYDNRARLARYLDFA